jgi:probable F420-dependent oxidoreductase
VDYGLALPSTGDGSSREGIEAACEIAAKRGFRDVWGTDHLLVDANAAEEYGRTFEIVSTMAWVAGRFPSLRIGTSVIVVPMRNAVVLAKELATLDELSGGRHIAWLGVGWNEPEFRNVGVDDRFHVRGAYLDETIELFRHLWSGNLAPFHGRFHAFDDFVFGPLPAQGGTLPVWIGGRNERALQRAGRVADGYHATSTSPSTFAERIPVIRAAADGAERPMPALSARVRFEIDGPPTPRSYSFHGSPAESAGEIRAFAEVGVEHIALACSEKDPVGITRAVDRFATEIMPLV